MLVDVAAGDGGSAIGAVVVAVDGGGSEVVVEVGELGWVSGAGTVVVFVDSVLVGSAGASEATVVSATEVGWPAERAVAVVHAEANSRAAAVQSAKLAERWCKVLMLSPKRPVRVAPRPAAGSAGDSSGR
jgi:hypothetical protein